MQVTGTKKKSMEHFFSLLMQAGAGGQILTVDINQVPRVCRLKPILHQERHWRHSASRLLHNSIHFSQSTTIEWSIPPYSYSFVNFTQFVYSTAVELNALKRSETEHESHEKLVMWKLSFRLGSTPWYRTQWGLLDVVCCDSWALESTLCSGIKVACVCVLEDV